LRSRLERVSKRINDSDLSGTLDDLHHISAELQYEVMQTRMVPVRNIFNRFPRMVRDLAADLGKDVEFGISGLDIELDRTVLDEIGDPIVHLLRNSIDHGIESAEKRAASGKPPVGSIRLTAVRERDHVTLVVSDDGKGIDLERVWNKAVQRGLANADEREDYSEGDILLFICVPGFSTAETATKVSGRGVGMDVVKGKIEHLGGTLRISSRPGLGTDFILQLPLTLAIVKALLVQSAGETFAVPLSAVTEVFAAHEVAVDAIDGVPVLLLRDGTVVPFRRLDSILYGADPGAAPEAGTHVLLLDVGGERHALHVHALAGRQEIVIKPLSRLLKDAHGFSGATILGDGRVMLILDPRTMFAATEAHR
jgi:two-component system chemotaxis sensor kinase CheA